jgi:hypothetical protein
MCILGSSWCHHFLLVMSPGHHLYLCINKGILSIEICCTPRHLCVLDKLPVDFYYMGWHICYPFDHPLLDASSILPPSIYVRYPSSSMVALMLNFLGKFHIHLLSIMHGEFVLLHCMVHVLCSFQQLYILLDRCPFLVSEHLVLSASDGSGYLCSFSLL